MGKKPGATEIAGILRREITKGVLASKDRLPAERILADARASAERIRSDARLAVDQELRRAQAALSK